MTTYQSYTVKLGLAIFVTVKVDILSVNHEIKSNDQ